MPDRPVAPEAVPVDAPDTYAFPSDPAAFVTWEHVVERLESSRNYWLATTYPDGRPHVTPLWGVWVDDALWFDGVPTTRWARNMAGNPSICVHLESGEDVMILEGRVDDLETDVETAERLKRAWREKYGRLEPEPHAQGIFRLRPTRVRAWNGSSLTTGARWHLAPS